MPIIETSDADSHPDEHLPGELTEVGSYRTTQEGFEHSVVVLALGEECWLRPTESGHQLMVDKHAARNVQSELARYDRECINWPPVVTQDATAQRHLDLLTPSLWALVLLGVYQRQLKDPNFTDTGALNATAVLEEGEWWRAFTALFLHADGSHLISNLFAGVFLFAAVLTVFGRLRGWLLIGIAAVVANLTGAVAHYPEYYSSIGASTAVFAALGLLTGRATRITINALQPHRWRSLFLPLAAGATVLALYGGGGPRIDVFAHVTGFGMGVMFGFIMGRVIPFRQGFGGQADAGYRCRKSKKLD